MTTTERRTKRRYAHELHPHPDEHEVRTLDIDVPYLYARAIGMELRDTGWQKASYSERGDRVVLMIQARQIALMADAMHQDLVGQEAWEWARSAATDETGEIVAERAVHYGVDLDSLKPYPCGPEPLRHWHYGPPDRRGGRPCFIIDGSEAACEECTEPVEPVRAEGAGE